VRLVSDRNRRQLFVCPYGFRCLLACAKLRLHMAKLERNLLVRIGRIGYKKSRVHRYRLPSAKSAVSGRKSAFRLQSQAESSRSRPLNLSHPQATEFDKSATVGFGRPVMLAIRSKVSCIFWNAAAFRSASAGTTGLNKKANSHDLTATANEPDKRH
jgi:hypothetical protein